jgi:hypothetical protein
MQRLRAWSLLWLIASCLTPAKGADVALVLDVSQNMVGPGTFLAQGARLATYELGPDDRVAVLSFSSSEKLLLPFTSDVGKIDDAFRKATGTIILRNRNRRLYDAIAAAVQEFPMAHPPDARRAIAVITNDIDLGSKHSVDDIIRDANARDLAVWVFLIANPYPDEAHVQNGHPRIPYPDVQFAAKQLHPIAERTGGKVSIHNMNGYLLREAIAACKRGSE